MKKFILFFLCMFTGLFSASDPEWDEFFAKQKADFFFFILDEENAFQIRLPERFQYAFGGESAFGTMWEFTLSSETIDNWTELVTICILPPIGEFEKFIKAWVHGYSETYNMDTSFWHQNQIRGAHVYFEYDSLLLPENIPNPGVREMCTWKVANGPEGTYVVQYAIRYDETISNFEKDRLERKTKALMDDLQIVDSLPE